MVGGGGDDEVKKSDKPAASPAKDGPIDPATAADLVARMKVLPRAELEALLGELGVQRVRDLKASDTARAKVLLAKFEGGAGGASAEIDPFA